MIAIIRRSILNDASDRNLTKDLNKLFFFAQYMLYVVG